MIAQKCENVKKIVFATNNAHKLSELRAIVGDRFEVLSLNDIDCHDDIPENEDTIEGNALVKARWVYERYGYDCFADDTGLFVDALGGEPGVHSARYAPGSGHDSKANMALLLAKLEDIAPEKRTACFRTCIALIEGGKEHLFEGRVDGHILTTPDGDEGFGYDPVFQPVEAQASFARMTAGQKNAISHRGRATQRLLEYLDSEI